ncbi:MAG TPA: FadR/GntR family transcriptional regulator [Thermoanaerobaculaceae bacterium]|nr:FadR/GntR family transcriptional regulator [Thermoanaerobaculaceae bacterium]HPS76623.1 FadR/GntR family transcriptional regulator [Thermoanaerobaculaceae bacterium]
MTGKTASDHSTSSTAGGRVVELVLKLIEDGRLKPGDRLPPERQLAAQVGLSRSSLRAGLRSLQAMGVMHARQGSGTYIVAGPPRLGEGPLRFLAALHGFTRDEMFEARMVLEVGACGLAASKATPEQTSSLADEVASMFASIEDPRQYLLHDVCFHRLVAAASGNPVLATLIDTLAQLVWETRRESVVQATDLKESADMHRRIYRAIRVRDADRARREMAEHLERARDAQAREPGVALAHPGPEGRDHS